MLILATVKLWHFIHRKQYVQETCLYFKPCLIYKIDALSEVVEAVRGRGVEVYLDGGVRTGSDVLKALARGAKAVFVGRPVLWGLTCDVSVMFIILESNAHYDFINACMLCVSCITGLCLDICKWLAGSEDKYSTINTPREICTSWLSKRVYLHITNTY